MQIKYPGSLHNHTQYSNLRLRDCIIKEQDLIDYAIELGHQVVAITDHESISCHIKAQKYYKKIKEKNPNFKMILGNEIYLCRNGLNKDNFRPKEDRYYHFILLAKDIEGHKQIREISTRAWKRAYSARGMWRVPTYYQDLIDIIGKNKGHVIGSSACLGSAIDTQLIRYRDTNDENLLEKIKIWIQQIDNIFGHGNFYLEMQPNISKDQRYVNRFLWKLSKEFNIPYIFTTDSHYLKKEDAFIHKAFLNSQKGDREVDSFYATTYLMSSEEIESFLSLDFIDEEIQEGYNNILNIASQCQDYDLTKSLKIPDLPWKNFYPKSSLSDWYSKIPSLKLFAESSYHGDVELAKAIIERVEQDVTLQNQKTYEAIEDNLQKIWISSNVNKAHWSAYLLNLQKIIDCCWEANSIVLPGRGSGVGFILLYILNITQINPLREKTPTYSFRFLNPVRVSPLDVDFDIEGGRRAQVLNKFREVYGNDRVSNVATFGSEKSKSAITTACRGLGIDVDISKYLSSLIPSDRGITRTLNQCFYGDEESGFEPIKQFVYEMTENYPEVWKVAQKIEGLVNRLGSHAGGVIFVDEPFTNSAALMRAPDGTVITAYELHDCEACSLIKYDALSVEGADRIHTCLDLLTNAGYIDSSLSLKERYEQTIGVYKILREDSKMWEMVWEHKILSLFQMEQQSGIQGIALVKPSSVEDLATLNSVIRLMAQEKGAEQPLDKFARFKSDINQWYREMDSYGLTKAEQKLLEPLLLPSSGICESQEGFMMLVQIPECGGFDLTWADRLRKSIAKKNPKEFMALEKEYFETIEKKHLSKNLCNYVWKVLVSTSKGYGFNKSHTLAYSIVALQEMNLAYRFPIIYWNCACLITEASNTIISDEEDEDLNYDTEELALESFEITYNNCVEEFIDDDEEDDDEEENNEDKKNKVVKKKKSKSANYGKVAKAIGKISSENIKIAPPDINKSAISFIPDEINNQIIYGMSGIVKIGADLVQEIINDRPYKSIEDFLLKVKIKKPQMVNLIKAGAFDDFGDRIDIMHDYINLISDAKKRITLQNMKMLIDFNLIPDEYDLIKRVYNFNKYLKKMKSGNYYNFDNIAFAFYEKNFSIDKLEPSEESESGFMIKQVTWDNIYQAHMDKIRPFIKAHASELLISVNNRLIKDMWNKYCLGSISKWEMDSVSFYSHPHELASVDFARYDIQDFFQLPEEPVVERVISIKGKKIPLMKINRIAGTVLDKDKTRKTITLLTTTGVVTVKIYGGIFPNFDKQISQIGADGKKHICETSWFKRGNKLIITGIRQGASFIAKKYKTTPYHLIEQIKEINDDGTLIVQTERMELN